MSQTEIALPDLNNEYSIAPSEVEAYNRDGHVLLRSVATPEEVAVYGPLIEAATDRYKGEILPLEERDTYGKAFWQITNLWERDAAVKKFVLARRFAKIAADLMNVPAVRLYHDQALFKEPQGGPTPWHQDEHYWPLDTDECITLWMPLVDASPAMGTLRFASGSQREGYLGAMPISDKSEEVFKQFVQERGYGATEPQAMSAGDASFHSGWTLHSAPGNNSDTMRSVMTIIYYADGARILPADKMTRGSDDLKAWLPGVQPGELAVSALNPLLYSE